MRTKEICRLLTLAAKWRNGEMTYSGQYGRTAEEQAEHYEERARALFCAGLKQHANRSPITAHTKRWYHRHQGKGVGSGNHAGRGRGAGGGKGRAPAKPGSARG